MSRAAPQAASYTRAMMIRAIVLALALLLVADRGFAQNADSAEPLPAPGAAIPQYRVEVVIFAFLDVDASEERLSHGQQRAPLQGGIPVRREPLRFDDPTLLESLTDEPNALGNTLGNPLPAPLPPDDTVPAPSRFRLLRPDELQLTAQFQALRRLPAYRPLLHGGWVQQGLPEDQAQPFDLSMLGSLNPTGTINLHLSRFLHLKVNLSYQSNGRTLPAEPDGGAGELTELEVAPRFALVTERQARSGELHYFDHPAFGVLIKVTPLPAQTVPGVTPAPRPAA